MLGVPLRVTQRLHGFFLSFQSNRILHSSNRIQCTIIGIVPILQDVQDIPKSLEFLLQRQRLTRTLVHRVVHFIFVHFTDVRDDVKFIFMHGIVRQRLVVQVLNHGNRVREAEKEHQVVQLCIQERLLLVVQQVVVVQLDPRAYKLRRHPRPLDRVARDLVPARHGPFHGLQDIHVKHGALLVRAIHGVAQVVASKSFLKREDDAGRDGIQHLHDRGCQEKHHNFVKLPLPLAADARRAFDGGGDADDAAPGDSRLDKVEAITLATSLIASWF
ncbi:hypothetical protein PsorP6_014544 [Peronosclerospora sorghi]|uniref:Uncharacterized protein n=1 Tax=Peronosclerospora sorghi TaxID=230839 RepID=A0ACC0VS16_9STRA|nr:hypothetical protein PsorP6_014544 [Peronosclerospora sorghi]